MACSILCLLYGCEMWAMRAELETKIGKTEMSVIRSAVDVSCFPERKRIFSVAAPIIWNELPTTSKSFESLASFHKNLKTYLFKIAFPP